MYTGTGIYYRKKLILKKIFDPSIIFYFVPREKHMLSETLDARAFRALGMGDAPFPRQPIGRR